MGKHEKRAPPAPPCLPLHQPSVFPGYSSKSLNAPRVPEIRMKKVFGELLARNLRKTRSFPEHFRTMVHTTQLEVSRLASRNGSETTWLKPVVSTSQSATVAAHALLRPLIRGFRIRRSPQNRLCRTRREPPLLLQEDAVAPGAI